MAIRFSWWIRLWISVAILWGSGALGTAAFQLTSATPPQKYFDSTRASSQSLYFVTFVPILEADKKAFGELTAQEVIRYAKNNLFLTVLLEPRVDISHLLLVAFVAPFLAVLLAWYLQLTARWIAKGMKRA
jgi:hypothetical protein